MPRQTALSQSILIPTLKTDKQISQTIALLSAVDFKRGVAQALDKEPNAKSSCPTWLYHAQTAECVEARRSQFQNYPVPKADTAFSGGAVISWA